MTINTKSPAKLPWLDNDAAAIPNLIARSSMFSVESKSEAQVMVNNAKIFTQGQYEITYTGISLNQSDLSVWLNLIKMTSHNRTHEILFSEKAFLSGMGQLSGGAQSMWLRGVFHKLASSLITIHDHNKGITYGGHLIESYAKCDISHKWMARINADLSPLFTPSAWSKIDWLIRLNLKTSPMALWFHTYYSTHKSPTYPISIDKLHELCGSKSSKKEFKRLLKTAAAKISTAAKSYDKEFELVIENNTVKVTHTLNKKNKST